MLSLESHLDNNGTPESDGEMYAVVPPGGKVTYREEWFRPGSSLAEWDYTLNYLSLPRSTTQVGGSVIKPPPFDLTATVVAIGARGEEVGRDSRVVKIR